MSRLPIRPRLTIAFAVAFVAVLVGTAAFVYPRLDSDLTEAVDETLITRAAAVAQSGVGAGAPLEAEDGFAQIVGPDGSVRDTAGGAQGPVLSPSEADRASGAPLRSSGRFPGS